MKRKNSTIDANVAQEITEAHLETYIPINWKSGRMDKLLEAYQNEDCMNSLNRSKTSNKTKYRCPN